MAVNRARVAINFLGRGGPFSHPPGKRLLFEKLFRGKNRGVGRVHPTRQLITPSSVARCLIKSMNEATRPEILASRIFSPQRARQHARRHTRSHAPYILV